MAHPQIIAHRGASGHAPENTFAAYRLAIELGSHFIEVDLQVSRDGHIVAIHDAVLQRTTNGRGSVAESTLAELRTIDAGRWFDRDFAGQRLSTLEEVLGLSREAEIGFYFQVRCPFSAEFGRSLIDAVRKVDAIHRVVVVSCEPTTLAALRKLDDAAITGLLIEARHSDPVAQAARCGARQLCLREDLVTAELVNRAHGAGLLAVAWTVNPPGRMRALLSSGVDCIVTDFPDRLRAIIEDSDAAGREPGRVAYPH
jgi:glycerophosphoryl diester phosphodiesterase